ncbi:UNVERIFIED_CONTAM: hypothetical protein K2H54_060459 [Gekko kuhli]
MTRSRKTYPCVLALSYMHLDFISRRKENARLQQEVHLAQKMAYTATRGNQYRYHQPSAYMDSRLAQSCQVHHYQHQKKLLTGEDKDPPKAVKQLSTESENEDYTVYECPGLAPSGEMEIHNPLFDTSTFRGCPP